MPESLLPFGPFHLVLLHLPIGVLAAIWFVDVLLGNSSDKGKNKTVGLLQLFLLLSSGLTIALGLAYEDFGSYGNEIEAHKFWGLVFGGCVLLTYLLYWTHRRVGRRSSKWLYLLSLTAATISMVITGHQGAELIHGKAFLSKPFKADKRRAQVDPVEPTSALGPSNPSSRGTPQPLIVKASASVRPRTSKSTNPVATSGAIVIHENAIDDAQDADIDPMAMTASAAVLPTADPRVAHFEAAQSIFKRHCYNCHGAIKQKGGYRLDTKQSIYLSGKSDLPAIVPGNAEKSELMYRMRLPRDDDDTMPPEQKSAVSAADIESVRQWIEAGAYWPDEAILSAAANDYVKPGDADTDQLIEQISRTGVKAEYNAWGDESIRIDLGVVDPSQIDQAIKQLNDFSNKLTWLDCSELSLTSGFFKHLQQCIKLQRLHLNGTDVTDKQLGALSQLAELSYLNLYNTQISDAGLDALHASMSLRKIFLSRTQVTPAGINQLKKALPNLEVVHQ